MPTHRVESPGARPGDRAQEAAFRGQGTYGSGGSYGVGGGFDDPRDGRPSAESGELRQDQQLRWYLGEARSGREGPFYGVPPRGYTRSDERIREEVCELLMRQGYIDPSRITISVKDGEVILEGEVDSRRDKHTLEQMIEGVLAVRDIDNRLRLARSS